MQDLRKKDSVAESIKAIMEKELSTKQKAIAKMSQPKDEIDAGDLAKLRAGHKPTKEETDPEKTVTDTLAGREKKSTNPFLSKKVMFDVPGNVKEEVVSESDFELDPLHPKHLANMGRGMSLKDKIKRRVGQDERGDARVRAGQPRSIHLRNKPNLPEEVVAEGGLEYDPLHPKNLANTGLGTPLKTKIKRRLGHDEYGDIRVRQGGPRSLHYDKKPNLPEEVEQIDELKKSTVKSYIAKKSEKLPGKDPKKDMKSMTSAHHRITGVKPTSEEVTQSSLKTLKQFKEEIEEPILDEMINEVLGKDATAGDYIHDFVHSDNPKFEGKSKAKRKEMALAAYYAKKRNEEVEVEESANPFSPDYKSQMKTKPGEKAGFTSKKISTGTVFSRKYKKDDEAEEKKK